MKHCKLERKDCKRTGVVIKNHNLLGIVIVFVPHVVTKIFIATLSQSETNSVVFALFGFIAVICQLITRFLGFVLFNNNDCNTCDNNHHHHYGGVSDNKDSGNDELGVMEDREPVN